MLNNIKMTENRDIKREERTINQEKCISILDISKKN